MADLIIKNGFVVTMNGRRQMFSNGSVAIEGGSILAVGPTPEIMERHRAAEVIDASGMLVMPGLIDAHNHPNQYLSKGIGDDVDIGTWLARVRPYEGVLSADEAYVGALGNFVEMIKTGTTCFNDPGGLNADALAKAAIDSGIRGTINRSTRDLNETRVPLPSRMIEDTATNLREAEAFVQRWNGAADGRLRAWVSLRSVDIVSDELCRGVKRLADRHGVGIHAHAACHAGENSTVQRLFGKRSLERLYELGLFGPNLYLIHMGFPDDREINWLAEHEVKVVHCPGASMHTGCGIIANGMIPKMMEAGITVALGTDSATCGRFLDMVRVMYLAACAHRDHSSDPTLIGAYKAVEMATIDGARASLWEDRIGSLEVGKLADIILIDMTKLHWQPNFDPIRNLVYGASGDDVDTVIIGGRIIMRHRVVLTVDENDLARRVSDAGKAWMDRSGVRAEPVWPLQ